MSELAIIDFRYVSSIGPRFNQVALVFILLNPFKFRNTSRKTFKCPGFSFLKTLLAYRNVSAISVC